MGSSVLLLVVAGLTTLAAGLAVRRTRAGSRRGLGGAVLQVLELARISTLFLAGNLVLGLVLVLATRTVSPFFVSVYVLNDASLVALSALQGAVFFCWRRREGS